MAGEVPVQAPGGIDKVGVVCESNHDMLSLLTDTSIIHCLASISSFISTGHQIDCLFILQKELSQLTPVTLPATMYSQNNIAAAANQHTITMLTDRARTPIGHLDPNDVSGNLRQHQILIYKWVILIYSCTNCFYFSNSSLQSPSLLQSRMQPQCPPLAPYFSQISPSRGVSSSNISPPWAGSWLSLS
jgi:hypothetical protein